MNRNDGFIERGHTTLEGGGRSSSKGAELTFRSIIRGFIAVLLSLSSVLLLVPDVPFTDAFADTGSSSGASGEQNPVVSPADTPASPVPAATDTASQEGVTDSTSDSASNPGSTGQAASGSTGSSTEGVDGTSASAAGSASGSSSASASPTGSAVVLASQTIADGTYAIVDSADIHMAVQVAGGSSSAGAALEIGAVNATANQGFTFTYQSDGYYEIASCATGLCLTSSGSSLTQEAWLGTDTQLWAVVDMGGGTYGIVCKDGGLRLDVAGAFTTSGTSVGLWTANGGANQVFMLQAFSPEHALADGTYTIGAQLSSDLALDVARGSDADGAALCVRGANGTATQMFAVAYLDNGYYTLTDVATGKLVDAFGSTAIGTAVVGRSADGSAGQQWAIETGADGAYRLVSRSSGLFLEVSGASSDPGTPLQIDSSDGAKDQAFSFAVATVPSQIVADGTYTVGTAPSSSLVLDASTYAGSLGLGLWNANGSPTQAFTITYVGNGYYTLADAYSGRLLDVRGNRIVEGTAVISWTPNGGANQQWAIAANADGTYRFVSRSSGLTLGVAGTSPAAGTSLAISAPNGEIGQCFTLTAASVSSQALADGIYTIAAAQDPNMVVDIRGCSSAAGAAVELWGSVDGNNQKFEVTRLADGTYTIMAMNSHDLLDVAAGSKTSGAAVIQYTPNGGVNQHWLIIDTGTADASGNELYTLVSAVNGLSLSVSGGAAAAGAALDTETASGVDSQHFAFVPTTLSRTVEDGTCVIASVADTSQVLDVTGASTDDGANIEVYNYLYARNQHFDLSYVSNGCYTITSCYSGLALTVVGSNVVQSASTGSDSQLWRIYKAGNGGWTFENKATGTVLDVSGGYVYNGVNVGVWASNGGANQRFVLETARSVVDGTYMIYSALDPSYAVDIAGVSPYNGANAELWTSNGGLNQQYHIVPVGGGYYKVLSWCSSGDKALDVDNSTAPDGANVQQWADTGASNQEWIIEEDGEGYFTFVSAVGGVSLDVAGGTAGNGANLVTAATSGSLSQKFVLRKVPTPDITPVISGNKRLDAALLAITATHPTLSSCYWYASGMSYRSMGLWPSYSGWTVDYALHMIDYGSGNCYAYAALFYWLARTLGYSGDVVEGYLYSNVGQQSHGWVEINGYVCDPELQNNIPRYNFYMRSYGNAPLYYSPVSRYTY